MADGRLRVLVVLMGSLGDVVRGFSILPPLKETAQAHITWLSEPAALPLVELHPLIDDVLCFNRRAPAAGIGALYRDLRARSFDVVLDMQRHFKSGIFTYLSGCRRRIGFHPKNAKEGNWIFQTDHIPFLADTEPKIDQYQLFLGALGISPTTPYEFGLKEALRAVAPPAGLPDGRFVAVVLSTSWRSKQWVPGGYARLLTEIGQRLRLPAVLVGSPSEQGLAAELVRAQGDSPVVDLVGRTTLPELGAVLARAAAGVGPDSGPGHLSSAVGVPYVTLFGPTDPRRVAPYGAEELAVVSRIGCHPCWRRECPGLDRLCMRLLSVQEIVEALERGLNRGFKGGLNGGKKGGPNRGPATPAGVQ